MDRTKKLLISLLVLGALAAVGTGTYATFNASVANQGNTFQSGTILLSQTLNSGSACLSYGVGTTISASNSNNCGAIWNLGSSTNKTSDIPGTGGLILKNTGTITATTLQLKSASACSSTNAQAVYGTGNICSGLTVGVQEETQGPLLAVAVSNGGTPATITLAANADPAYPLGTMLMLVNAAGNTQVVTLAAASLANATTLNVNSFTSDAAYATTDHIYVPATGGCFVGYTESSPTSNANTCVFDSTATTAAVAGGNLAAIDSGVTLTGGLGAGASRYFAFGIALENSADNTYQGLCIGSAPLTCGTYTMNWTIQ